MSACKIVWTLRIHHSDGSSDLLKTGTEEVDREIDDREAVRILRRKLRPMPGERITFAINNPRS